MEHELSSSIIHPGPIKETKRPIQEKSSPNSKSQDKQEKRLNEDNQSEQQKTVGFFQLFRFAQKFDYILIAIGTVAALAMGTALPAFALLWGDMTDAFSQGGDSMVEASKQVMYKFIYIGLGVFVAGWLMFACWMIAGERQSIACRKAYLKSLLRQQIGWFDMINQSELASKFTTDSFAFGGAIGEKVSTIIMTIGMFIAGFAIAFSTGWLLTLVTLCSLPAIGLAGYLYIYAIESIDKKSSKDYSKAGGLAEQALSGIKTVKQMNGQLFEQVQYDSCLKEVTKKATKYAAIAGAGIGALFLAMLSSYALGFWYGSVCVEGTQGCLPSVSKQNYTAGDVLVVFFSILMAGFNLSQLTPSMKKIAEGRQAAARIYEVIDRKPLIGNAQTPIVPQDFKGVFRLQNVTFAYPKDKSRKILDGITIQFNKNCTALVGESGCGKSTIFQLIMRFYDPDEGAITLDGVDLKLIDLKWLRQSIGYVGQEPVLFATTIRQNLLFGKEDATELEINQALKKAEAYDFIQELDKKLETYVGHGGGQLSGGQKQRIAIARALLRNPKILLLDEATSALDRKNERLIQSTLDKISNERTTMTIAHRAKTIMNADIIYVLSKGKIQEKGKFNELKRFKGHTYEDQEKEHMKSPSTTLKVFEKPGFLDLTKDQLLQTKNSTELQPVVELSKQEKEKKQQQELLKKYQDSIFSRLFSYASDSKCLFLLGILVAMTNGLIFPAFSIFLSKMLNILIKFTEDQQKARRDVNTYALIYLLLGILAFIMNLLQMMIFSSIGQTITKKIRYQTYGKMLRMPIPWFDLPKNNAGSLTSKLSADCKNVNGLVTTFVAISVQNLTSLVAGIIIAFVFEWRTSLVALGLIPFMIIAGVIQMKFTTGFSDKSDAAYKESAQLIMESMMNIRTVSSFGYENVIFHKYEQKLVEPFNLAVKKGNCSGLLFGFSQIVMFVIFALIFYIGTIFIRDNPELTVADVFTAIYAITFSAMTVGNNAHFLPDVASGKNAAASLFEILDSEDEDQKQIREQSKLIKTGIKGNFSLKNIEFKYETRNINVFDNFSIDLNLGKKIAFVGHSGCGKSTIFQLLQRFYEPSKGQILIDGVDIKDYDIHYLRSCFGVVSQEPVLFNGSFKYNIIYNMDKATDDEMVNAAKKANALSFIEGEEKLVSEKQIKGDEADEPQTSNDQTGFNKSVGVKGSHISGGQKQRVAIARAILRNPAILFLDEATSALDSANEKKVQGSLDEIMKGRTTISIAHRIDTIKNSDQIHVFEKGCVVEQGRYDELVNKKGYFYNLERGTDFL